MRRQRNKESKINLILIIAKLVDTRLYYCIYNTYYRSNYLSIEIYFELIIPDRLESNRFLFKEAP